MREVIHAALEEGRMEGIFTLGYDLICSISTLFESPQSSQN